MAGHRPVSGASVELYAAGTGGLGSASKLLLYRSCRVRYQRQLLPYTRGVWLSFPHRPRYMLLPAGAIPNVSAGQNSALMLTGVARPLQWPLQAGYRLPSMRSPTVGSIWPLAKYWTSPTHLGSKANDSSFSERRPRPCPNSSTSCKEAPPGTPHVLPATLQKTSKLYSLADAPPRSASIPPVAKLATEAPAVNCFRWPVRAGSNRPRPIR